MRFLFLPASVPGTPHPLAVVSRATNQTVPNLIALHRSGKFSHWHLQQAGIPPLAAVVAEYRRREHSHVEAAS